MAIMAAKIALVVIGLGFTVVFASLVVLPSLDLLRSSQSGLWITVQLIIMAIWKLSDATRHGNRPNNHENPASPPLDAPETWYDVPSSAAAFTTTAPPGLDSSPSPPAEPVIPPEIASEAAASSSGDGDDSMDATWETVAEAAKSNSGDGDDSMDATWSVIMAGGRSHARPVLKKNPTWERVQNLEVLAEKASAGREMRKSKTFKEIKAKAMVEEGWRGRDVLVVSQDELFRRVETFIKKQREHLRLQRQESEQRRSLEKLRRHSY